MAEPCIFCRIARGEIHTQMVANVKDIAAFRDLNPQAPVHILIIPKKHITSLDDASDTDLLGRMLALAAAIAESLAAAGPRPVLPSWRNHRIEPRQKTPLTLRTICDE